MTWVRVGEMPESNKVSFVVAAKDHPELARWIWSLPYRGASAMIRDVLSEAARAVVLRNLQEGNAPSVKPRPLGKTAPKGGASIEIKPQAVRENNQSLSQDAEMSDAVMDVMSNLDMMFANKGE